MSEERHRLQTKAKNYGTKLHRLNISRSTNLYNFKSFAFLVKKAWKSAAGGGMEHIHMYANNLIQVRMTEASELLSVCDRC